MKELVHFRPLRPGEGRRLTEAIRAAYGGSYDVRWVYDEAEVEARLEAGTYVSFVAETGDGEFLVVGFAEHGIPIRPEEEDERVAVAAAKPTAELLASPALADRAELHWRFSLPLSVLVLGVLAVPLSRTAPREGRFARFGMALLIYMIYTNLLSIGRVWLERGVVDDRMGLWWVHAIVGLLALLMLAREGGWFVRARMLEPQPA